MRIYFVEIDGESGVSCFGNPADALEHIGQPRDYDPDMQEEVAEARKVISEGKGCFEGDWISAWIEIKSHKWFGSLPEDEAIDDPPS